MYQRMIILWKVMVRVRISACVYNVGDRLLIDYVILLDYILIATVCLITSYCFFYNCVICYVLFAPLLSKSFYGMQVKFCF